jgi:hypothetical protein
LHRQDPVHLRRRHREDHGAGLVLGDPLGQRVPLVEGSGDAGLAHQSLVLEAGEQRGRLLIDCGRAAQDVVERRRAVELLPAAARAAVEHPAGVPLLGRVQQLQPGAAGPRPTA